MEQCCSNCEHYITTGGDMVPYGGTSVPLPDSIECDCPDISEDEVDANLEEDGVNCKHFQERQPVKCYRCGYCCKTSIAIVPKTETSDISPEKLSTMEWDACQKYLDEHSMGIEGNCPWLVNMPDGKTTACKVHDLRGSCCRDYPDAGLQTHCHIGKHRMEGK